MNEVVTFFLRTHFISQWYYSIKMNEVVTFFLRTHFISQWYYSILFMRPWSVA